MKNILVTVMFMVLPSLSLNLMASDKYFYDSERCTAGAGYRLGERLIEVEEIFQTLLDVSGIKGSYYLCPVVNPESVYAKNALIADGGVVFVGQYINYDSEFIKHIKRDTGHWGVAAVVAHELAHHLLGHTFDGHGSLPPKELKADFLAGKLLQRSGASFDNAIFLAQQPFMITNGRSLTHPDRPERIDAFGNGWHSGCQDHPTHQCPSQSHQIKQVRDDKSYTETTGYLRLSNLAQKYKGRAISSDDCYLYADVSVEQTERNKQEQCGFLQDAYEGSRWSSDNAGQYHWCMSVSAYATEKEADFREKKLKECLLEK